MREKLSPAPRTRLRPAAPSRTVVRAAALGLAALGVLAPSVAPATGPSAMPADALPSRDPDLQVATASELGTVPLSQIPLDLHRRAARFFENMRRSSDSPWFDAHLAGEATAILRPGVDGAAYYEIPVAGPDGSPRGYMLVTSGDYDFPVAGAVKDGISATAELSRIAAADGKNIARIQMPTLFTFVAEDERGDVVAQIGALPPKVEGLTAEMLELTEAERTNRPLVSFSSWSSWRELAEAQASPSAIDREVMRRNAEPFWDAERLELENAEWLDPQASRRVALLARGPATFEVRGPGARHVAAERVTGPAGEQWVRLRPTSLPRRGVAELSLAIAYGSGEHESLSFVVAPPESGVLAAVAPTMTPTCTRAAFRTHTGHYLRAVDGGKGALDARSDTVGPWETFTLEHQSDGTFAMRAGPTGFYVQAVPTNACVDGSDVGNLEKFTFVPGIGGRFALRSRAGNHMAAEGGGGREVTVKRPAIGNWESFTVLCNPPPPTSVFPFASNEPDAWKKQRKYAQIPGSVSPNKSPCSTGCGPTAWAMLIGWADHVGHMGHSVWSGMRRVYTANNGRGDAAVDVAAPEYNDGGIKLMTVELRDDMNDWGAAGCAANDNRFTVPHIMAQVNQYFWGRVPVRVIADYDGLGIGTGAGAANVLKTLEREGRPTAIGTGHFAHYPVAFGVHRFTPRLWDAAAGNWVSKGPANTVLEVNWGWGEKRSRSVPLHSWFRGVVDASSWTRVAAVTKDCSLRAVGGAIAKDARHDRDYYCRTHLHASERHVAFEVADRLLTRDVLPTARSKGLKVCLLKHTDIQCAPCNTTDRLIVRITSVAKSAACPADTVEVLE